MAVELRNVNSVLARLISVGGQAGRLLALSALLALVTVLVALCLVSETHAVDSPAQCQGQREPDLRASALASSDPAVSDRYITCFAYGDGAISVKKHQSDLREAQACTKAKSSDDVAVLRNFVLTFSGSVCAPEVAERLKQVQNLSSFVTYDNTNFIGTAVRRGTTDGEVACANACQVGKAQCAGYSFDLDQKVCTLWSTIQNRIPRGNTKSGSFSPIAMAAPRQALAPQAEAIQPPAAPAQGADGTMRYMNGADIPGGDYDDIRDIDLRQCNAICIQSPNCAAFTYNTEKNACFIKGSVGNPIVFPNAISGIKAGRVSAPAYRNSGNTTSIMEDMDLPNEDTSADYALLRGVSLPDCQRMCVADGKCAAFTYNGQKAACILKSSFGRSVMFLGATSGIKQ